MLDHNQPLVWRAMSSSTSQDFGASSKVFLPRSDAMQPDIIHSLDKITVMIDHLATEFQVPFRNAAHRCVDLGIITQDQWQGIQDIARQRAMEKLLKDS
jgi:hypothetical protein